jgi:hypothetical protein
VAARTRAVPWRRLGVVYVVWSVVGHAVLAIAASVSSSVYPVGLDEPGWLAPTTAYDGAWYELVAVDGYTSDPRSTAYFPLFPGLLRGFHTVGIDTPVATLLINSIAGFAAVFALHQLVADRHGQGVAWRAVVLFLAFPWSLFLLATYPEALFCACSFAAFLAAQRCRWPIAFVLAGLATAGRLQGIAVAVFVVLLYARARGWSLRRLDRDAWAVPLSVSGLVAYMTVLWIQIGDPLDFRHAYDRAPEWQRGALVLNVFDTLGESVGEIADWLADRPPGWLDAAFVELTGLVPWIAAVAMATLAWIRRPIDRWWTAYVAAGLAVVFASGTFVAANRDLVPLFGLFVAAAVWLEDRPRLFAAGVALSAAALLFYEARFGAQEWAG